MDESFSNDEEDGIQINTVHPIDLVPSVEPSVVSSKVTKRKDSPLDAEGEAKRIKGGQESETTADVGADIDEDIPLFEGLILKPNMLKQMLQIVSQVVETIYMYVEVSTSFTGLSISCKDKDGKGFIDAQFACPVEILDRPKPFRKEIQFNAKKILTSMKTISLSSELTICMYPRKSNLYCASNPKDSIFRDSGFDIAVLDENKLDGNHEKFILPDQDPIYSVGINLEVFKNIINIAHDLKCDKIELTVSEPADQLKEDPMEEIEVQQVKHIFVRIDAKGEGVHTFKMFHAITKDDKPQVGSYLVSSSEENSSLSEEMYESLTAVYTYKYNPLYLIKITKSMTNPQLTLQLHQDGLLILHSPLSDNNPNHYVRYALPPDEVDD